MGIFDQSNYIVNTGIIEQVFQCTAKVILLAKMIKLWTFYEKAIYSQWNITGRTDCFVVITKKMCMCGTRVTNLYVARCSRYSPGGATIRCHFWNSVVLRQSRGLRPYTLCRHISSCIGSRITHSFNMQTTLLH